MNKPSLPVSFLQPKSLKRRRALAATAAALSIAGCNMNPQPAQTLSPQATYAAEKAKAFQAEVKIDDPVDRERIRAAMQKANSGSGATTPVILASASGSESGHPTAAPAVPTTPATPPKPANPEPETHATPTTPSASAAPLAPEPKPTVAESTIPATPTPAPANLVLSPSPETPTVAAPPGATGIVVASPLSGDTLVPTATIAPFTPPATPSASAMSTMTAMVTPSQIAIAEPASPAAAAAPSVDDAMDILRKNIADHPTLNTALALALLDAKGGGDMLKKLPESDQRLAGDLLSALDAMKTKTTAPTLAERAAPILDAAKGWQEDADLTLPRLVLASRVDSSASSPPPQPPSSRASAIPSSSTAKSPTSAASRGLGAMTAGTPPSSPSRKPSTPKTASSSGAPTPKTSKTAP